MLPAMQAYRRGRYPMRAQHPLLSVPNATRRIEEAIVALNYTPNIRARQLRTGQNQYHCLAFSSVPLAIASGASRPGIYDAGGGVNVRDDGAGNSMR